MLHDGNEALLDNLRLIDEASLNAPALSKSCSVKDLTGHIQALEVAECFAHSFPTKAVQAPEQHEAETPLVSIGEEVLKLVPLGGTAAFLVVVLMIDRMGGLYFPFQRSRRGGAPRNSRSYVTGTAASASTLNRSSMRFKGSISYYWFPVMIEEP